jgi:adenosylcobinamide kinase/adenosylcobinamide-phosphate guanylyltransferase
LLVATAQAGDAEMAVRIARHREQRRARVPKLNTLEQADGLAELLTEWSRPHRMIIVDCLTLWLTQLSLPLEGAPLEEAELGVRIEAVVAAVRDAPGPVRVGRVAVVGGGPTVCRCVGFFAPDCGGGLRSGDPDGGGL